MRKHILEKYHNVSVVTFELIYLFWNDIQPACFSEILLKCKDDGEQINKPNF